MTEGFNPYGLKLLETDQGRHTFDGQTNIIKNK
jgi:hypothetical protein